MRKRLALHWLTRMICLPSDYSAATQSMALLLLLQDSARGTNTRTIRLVIVTLSFHRHSFRPSQRAGCCAGHPLDFQHTLATPHRHVCQFGGHSPAARTHPSPRASRTTFSPGEWCTLAPPGPPPLISHPACKPLGPLRKTKTKQGG